MQRSRIGVGSDFFAGSYCAATLMSEQKVETEAPPGSDYLRGLTARCHGNDHGGGCLNRVTSPGDELCTECHVAECNDELKELIAKEKSKTGGKWFVKWTDPEDVSHFVCCTCDRRWVTSKYGYKVPAVDHPLYSQSGSKLVKLVPIAGCCTNISGCSAARLFWGPNQYEAELELEKISALRW